MRTFLKSIPAWLAILCSLVALGAEADPFVKITSPKSGIVVRPGEHLTIRVDATPNAFDRVIALAFAAWSSSGPPYDLAIWVGVILQRVVRTGVSNRDRQFPSQRQLCTPKHGDSLRPEYSL